MHARTFAFIRSWIEKPGEGADVLKFWIKQRRTEVNTIGVYACSKSLDVAGYVIKSPGVSNSGLLD